MELPKNLTDSILQGVLDKVMDNITPGDDTPDDDDGILGMVKNALSPDEDKETGVMNLVMGALSGGGASGGIMDMLGDLLGGGQKEQPAARQESPAGGMLDMLGDLLGGSQDQQSSKSDTGGGLGDILGGLFGGSQREEEPSQSAGSGILDALGGILGGGSQRQSQRQTAAKDSGLMGMITDAIGGEGAIGDILQSVLKSKGVTASNLNANPALMDSIKDIVTDLIKDFVINKIKSSLLGGSSSSQGNTVSRILDMLTPDN